MTRFFLCPFDWSGTASRRQFWLSLLVALGVLGSLVLITMSFQVEPWVPLSVLCCLQFTLWPIFVKRLHAMGRSGYWTILLVVPFLFIPVFLWLGIRRPKHQPVDAWPSKASHRVGQALLLLLVCVSLSRAYWSPYWIPAGSMKPALLIGDYLIVSHYGKTQNPQHGDVLVFRHPVHGTAFIKRLIGLPGDEVKISNGKVSINGTWADYSARAPFEEPMAPTWANGQYPRCQNAPGETGNVCIKSQWLETLPNGREYPVLDIADQALDHTGIFQVPKGYYFFLGDNRDNSSDSRIAQAAGGIGFVPRDALIGRAELILFSSQGPQLLSFSQWRQDRFWVPVH